MDVNILLRPIAGKCPMNICQEHFCQKLSKSVGVRRSYSIGHRCRFLGHSVVTKEHRVFAPNSCSTTQKNFNTELEDTQRAHTSGKAENRTYFYSISVVCFTEKPFLTRTGRATKSSSWIHCNMTAMR